MAKKKTPSTVTPRGAAVYPKLVAPDEYEGEKNYKTGLLLDPANDESHAAFIDRVNEAAEAAYEDWREKSEKELASATGAKKAKLKKALEECKQHTSISPEYDDEGDETGRVIFNAKMKAEGISKQTKKPWSRKCPLFDSSGKEVTGKVDAVWGGSILKLEVTLNPFDMNNGSTILAGVSGRLEAVQIIDLKAGNAGGKFGVEEGGYCAEEDEQTSRFDDDIEDDADADEDF